VSDTSFQLVVKNEILNAQSFVYIHVGPCVQALISIFIKTQIEFVIGQEPNQSHVLLGKYSLPDSSS